MISICQRGHTKSQPDSTGKKRGRMSNRAPSVAEKFSQASVFQLDYKVPAGRKLNFFMALQGFPQNWWFLGLTLLYSTYIILQFWKWQFKTIKVGTHILCFTICTAKIICSSLCSIKSFGLNSKLKERNSLIPHSLVWEHAYSQWFRCASDQGMPCAQTYDKTWRVHNNCRHEWEQDSGPLRSCYTRY